MKFIQVSAGIQTISAKELWILADGKHFYKDFRPWFQPSWVSHTFLPLGSMGPPFLVIIKLSFALRSSGNNRTKPAQDKSFLPSTRISDHKTVQNGNFPGGLVVKNLPSYAGDAGWIPGQGTKIPHAMGQLSLHAITKEPTCHNQRSTHDN